MAANPSDDLFGRPTRGAYPKLEELDGKLVLIQPSKVETVPGYKNVGTTERITADVTVIDEDDPASSETISDMYLSQRGLVPMLKRCLKPGNKPFVLGRVAMSPTKDYKDDAEKAGGMAALLESWAKKGGKGEKPQFFWDLTDFTDEEANAARAWLASVDQFAAPSS